MALFVKKYEQQVTNTTQTIALNNHSLGYPMPSFIGSVNRIIPEEGVCLVDSDYMGKNARIPYDPSSGIREGGACMVGIFQNVPRVIGPLNFGNNEMVIIDPTGGDAPKKVYLKKTDATKTGDYEKATGAATGVMHKDGEKVIACDFSGLRAGIDHAVMFYEANAKFICTDGVASTIAESIVSPQ